MTSASEQSPPQGWCNRQLRDLCYVVGGGTPSRSQPKYWNGDIPWASVKDFSDEAVFLYDTKEHITQEGLESSASALVQANTPVVCTRMAVGRCALTIRPTAINQDLKALLLRDDFDSRFFIRLLKFYGPTLDRVSVGSTVRGITTHDLLSLVLCYPDKSEQSRIAAVLDTVDEAIAKTEAVIVKLKQVRAGLLHDLLSRGLDEHGQLRDPIAHPDQFQDSPLGRIPREWRWSRFDEVIEGIGAGKSPDYPDYPAPPGEWGVLKVSAILPEGFRPYENKWVTRAMHQNPAYEVHDGDLLISRSNTYELVGIVSLVRNPPPRLRMMAGLTRIERARGFLEAARLSEDWLETMRSRAFVLEAHHTTHIEGTRLTLEQAERLLAGEAVAGTDPDDVRELLNYRDAFEFVSGYLNDGGPITEGLIREIHRRLVVGVRGGSAAPGEYRRVQNYVVNAATGQTVYTPPPPYDVPPLMAELVAWLNTVSDVHPVLVSGIAQFQLVHIHPFVDGNGRTSRLLSTLCLYRAGYDFKRLFSISEYYDRNRTGFYTALQSVREHEMDLTGWLDYFVEGLATQMDEVTERGKRAIRRDVIAREYALNPRQVLAVGHLLERDELRIEELEVLCPGVNRRTLQRDLRDLVQQGVIKRIGAARAVRYILQIKGL